MTKNNKKYFEDELLASLIEPHIAQECGIYELPASEKVKVAKLLNRPVENTPEGPFAIFPYFNPFEDNKEITVNVKSANPLMEEGKPKKYLRPVGSKNHLYFPRIIKLSDLLNNSIPITFTEGEKKTICANVHGFLTVGLNGVQNWKSKGDDGVSRPLEVFSKLNLSGRKVLIAFDSDTTTNENVLRAEADFAKYLQTLGAKVRILRYPDMGDDAKWGLDDYILKFGIDEFKKLAKQAALPINTSTKDIEAYLSDLKDLDPEAKNNKIMTASYAITSKDKTVVDLLIKNISKNSGISREVIKDIISGIKKQNNKLKYKNVIIYDSELTPQAKFLESILEAMKKDGRFFIKGNDIVLIDDGKIIPLDNDNLPVILNDITEIKYDGKFRLLPKEQTGAVIHSPMLRKGLPEITLFTQTPTYDKDFNLVKAGYNPESKIYFCSKSLGVIKPKVSTKKIEELLVEFCLKDNGSKDNVVGMMLTGLLRHKWVGEKPLWAVLGNQPNIGKSTLVKSVGLVITGKPFGDVDYNSNEEALGKLIASVIRESDFINFDNIKHNGEIESGSLERLITSPNPAFRMLGANKLIDGPNNYIVSISINGARFGQDLLTRMAPIELWYSGDPNTRTFKKDIEKWVMENRKELVEELIGMIENWKKKGFSTSKIKYRFRNWSSVIGGILEANGYNKFLANYESATTTYIPEAVETGELFSDKLNEWVTATDLVKLCQERGCFKGVLAKGSPESALGKALAKLVDKPVPLPDGGTFTLRKSITSNKASYCAEDKNSKTELKGKQ